MAKFEEVWGFKEEAKPKEKKKSTKKVRGIKEKEKSKVTDTFLAGGALMAVSLFFIFFSAGMRLSLGGGSEANVPSSQNEMITIVMVLGYSLFALAVMVLLKAALKLRDYKSRLAKEAAGLPDWKEDKDWDID